MAGSAQKDSRDGGVELDYDYLTVDCVTTFQRDVTFNGFLVNATWPRMYKVIGTNFVYPPALETTIPLTAQTILTNEFTTPPTNSAAGWLNISNAGVITDATAAGSNTWLVQARIIGVGGFTAVGEQLYRLYVDPVGAPTPFVLAATMINPVLLGPTQGTIRLEATYPAFAGDQFYVTMESANAQTVQLELSVSVLK